MRALSQLITPSCSHSAPAPISTASRAIGSVCSGRRKTSTMSMCPFAAASASVATAGIPRISVSLGLTGMHS